MFNLNTNLVKDLPNIIISQDVKAVVREVFNGQIIAENKEDCYCFKIKDLKSNILNYVPFKKALQNAIELQEIDDYHSKYHII